MKKTTVKSEKKAEKGTGGTKKAKPMAKNATATPRANAKIHVLTYGCTFNFADSDAIARAVGSAGKYAIAKDEKDAEAVIINTCSVKDSTQEKILFKARQLETQGKKLVVTGCLAQVSPELIEKAVPSASIVGVWSNGKIAEVVGAALAGKKVVSTKKSATLPFNVSVDGIFARVQISRGCLGHCTYCSTKIARGHLQSFPQEEIVDAVKAAVARGAKEIQLTSQDTACYGLDLGGKGKGSGEKGGKEETRTGKQNLATLLEKICAIPGRFRVRIGMGNPEHFWKIRKELARVIRSTDKAYRFLHIPVQSGSDSVLAAMGRRYKTKDYTRLAEYFHQEIPDLTIETDVIVGFPTETQKDFKDTLALVKKTRPQITNISKYSPRPKTVAAKMAQVDRRTINARSSEINELCRRIALEENGKLVGKTCIALVTEKKAGGFSARTPNYKTALLKRGAIGSFITVRTTGYGQCYLKARTARAKNGK